MTLMARMHALESDRRANPLRFMGKRVRQDERRRTNLKARERRLRKIGWPIQAFPS